MTRLATPIFDHAHPINFWSAFNCYEHVSTCQKSVYSICSSFRQSILEFHHMTGHIHFWPYQSLNFRCPFNLHEFARACKKSVNSWEESWDQICSICYGEIVNFKICNLTGWEHFGLHLRNRIFPKHRICAGTQQIINIFIIEKIEWKWMTKFFFKFKKPIFGSFPQFLGQKKFFRMVTTTLAKSR